MCAATAGQRGKKVVVLEHNGQPGRKILISGGGRCNFTNLHCKAENFLSANRHFAKSALAGFEPLHFVELVERYGIAWHEKTLGQLFCDGSARAILDMLLAECELGGVELVLNAHGIEVEGGGGDFRVRSSAGAFRAEALVVACGGLSIPSLGATGLGYELARQFGLEGGRTTTGAGSVGSGRRRGGLDGVGGRGGRGGGLDRRSEERRARQLQIQGEDAGDASRAERAGGLAGFVLLAAGGDAGAGFCA